MQHSVEQRAYDEIQQLLSQMHIKSVNYFEEYYAPALVQKIKCLNIAKKNALIQQIQQAASLKKPVFDDSICLQDLPLFEYHDQPIELEAFDTFLLQEMPNIIQSTANDMRDIEKRILSIQQLDMDLYKENYFNDDQVVQESLECINDYKMDSTYTTDNSELEECKRVKEEAAALLKEQNSKINNINSLAQDILQFENSLLPLVDTLNIASETAYTYIREHDLHHLLVDDDGHRLLEMDENRLLLEQPLIQTLQLLKLNPFAGKEEVLEALNEKPFDIFKDLQINQRSVEYATYIQQVEAYNEAVEHLQKREQLDKEEIKNIIEALNMEIKDITSLEWDIEQLKNK